MSKQHKGFRTAEELGRHFDDHEVTEENSEATTATVEKRYDPTLTMRIPEADLARLKELADERGVPTATMGRMLLLEKLRGEGAPRTAALRLLETIGADEGLRDTLRTVIQGGKPKESRRRESKDAPQKAPRRSAKAICGHVVALLSQFIGSRNERLIAPQATLNDSASVLPDGSSDSEFEQEGMLSHGWN